MDRFLSLEKLSLNKLQVMASGCLSIAAKLRDPNFITPSQIIYYTDYSINQLQLLVSLSLLFFTIIFFSLYSFVKSLIFF